MSTTGGLENDRFRARVFFARIAPMQITNKIVSNPVARGLSILGDRWTILILRDAFLGRHRFGEFREHTGAARGTLSKRLEFLLAEQILYKQAYQTSPPRYDYKLTEKGLGLYPWALLIWKWESQWAEQQDDILPLQLFHSVGDGHALQPECVCRHCQQPLHYDDVERLVMSKREVLGAAEVTEMGQAFGNQRRTRGQLVASADHSLGHVVDIIGDRWSTLILAAAFIGIRRYDDFLQQLGIATNILADRLKLLVETEVLQRSEYQANPPRHEYRLTDKGKSLYPQILSLRQWVLDYLPSMGHPFRLVHRNCGADLAIDVICGDCKTAPQVGEVRFN